MHPGATLATRTGLRGLKSETQLPCPAHGPERSARRVPGPETSVDARVLAVHAVDAVSAEERDRRVVRPPREERGEHVRWVVDKGGCMVQQLSEGRGT